MGFWKKANAGQEVASASQRKAFPPSEKRSDPFKARAEVKRRERVFRQEEAAEHPEAGKGGVHGGSYLFLFVVGLIIVLMSLPGSVYEDFKPGPFLYSFVVLSVLGICVHVALSIIGHRARSFGPFSIWTFTAGVLLLTIADARLQETSMRWLVGHLYGEGGIPFEVVFLAPNLLVPLLLGLVYDSRTAFGLGLITSFVLSVGEVAQVGTSSADVGLITVCVFLTSLVSVCLVSQKAPRLSNRRQLFHLLVKIGSLQTILTLLVALRLNDFSKIPLADCWEVVFVPLIVLYLELFLSSLIAVDILRRPIENLTNRISDFTLMRYTDPNNDLLRRLAREAPGTYHHSTQVGDLAHNAALAIGANELLARVGAYYHDIGKLEHPFYFTENQSGIGNPHDELPPAISRMLIMNHVKTGALMAEYHHFPAVLKRFIETHHGRTVLVWFQNKAKEEIARMGQTGRNGDAITDFYRYPGPLPVTREESILMLADSVEAASRSMRFYEKPAIERLVRQIVKNKWLDGQLAESKLTNAELTIVVDSFIQTLIPLLHGRLPYPPQKK